MDTMRGQVEFFYNSYVSRSTGKTLFKIMYTKELNHMVDLAIIPKPKNSIANTTTTKYTKVIEEVRNHLHRVNLNYKSHVDIKQQFKVFRSGELVRLCMRKDRIPPGTYSKAKTKENKTFHYFEEN